MSFKKWMEKGLQPGMRLMVTRTVVGSMILNSQSEAVHVRVLFYPPGSDASTEPTVMTIINHAPGEEYGWLAKGMEHALEVEFPG